MQPSKLTWQDSSDRPPERLVSDDMKSGERQDYRGQIAVICPGGLENGGGIGRQMGYALKALEGRTHGIDYRVIDSRGPWFLGASRIHTAGALVYLAGALAKLLALRLSPKRTFIHVNVTGRGSTLRKLVLSTCLRGLRLPYLLHVHDYAYAADYSKRGPFMQRRVRGMFRAADRVLVLGMGERQRMIDAMLLDPAKVVVLHNAVPDPLEVDPPGPHEKSGPIRIAFLGHLSERKGVPDLLNALADQTIIGLDWRATLAGGGDIPRYAKLAESLGIADKVTFPGWINQQAASQLYREADVVVLPSYAEGMAMSVLEGLSYGLTVVTTPVGAHDEVIEDGQSGLLVAPGDVPGLAKALRRVITEPLLRTFLGGNARLTFLEKFEVGAYGSKLVRMHAALLANRSQS
ncbi:MAG TPA: glycosyltransferase family 4 protein [Rhodopila sp.]|uniref:glycosyltransferase family 4 protein n=1 Tax=Rhodopila sp. TaxID=2480087 RepID=UPI002B9C9B91|nr:glycosyltransferase family 4 protein [Rhodopila sp.]HVY17101.1 glycosyltransferase family 4 protein [Rhodopila sp.]